MRFDVITLFPGFFESPLKESILGRAVAGGLVKVFLSDIRDYTEDKHRTADDAPYGGGAGMVMKPGPVVAAIEDARKKNPGAAAALLTPQGKPFNQEMAWSFAKSAGLVIVCGRYEGVDERIRRFVDAEISIGDYVLTGGEAAAVIVIDAVSRLVPGVLGDAESAVDESFAGGLLEYPQYTRPEDFRGMKVPEVLLSGNHGEIKKWRREERIRRTALKRPDIVESADVTDEEREFIKKLTKGH